MKLCWLIANDEGGGIASVALSCCRQAVIDGHDASLLMISPSSGWVDEYATTFPVHDLRGPEPPDRPRRLIEWLKDNPQDVLFINDCSAVTPALPYIPSGTRSVFVVHDTADRYWKPAIEHEQSLDAIVAVSNVVADRFKERLREPNKLSVLHNGTVFPSEIDVLSSEDRENDILFLGGDNHFKGADDGLRIWKHLVEKRFNGRLHWFGSVDAEFRQQVDSVPEADRVILHGRVKRSKIFECAAKSKVMLMASRAEAFPMAVLESLGMGCLPIAWDIEIGTVEIIQPGKTGFLARLGNHEHMASQVVKACAEHDKVYEQAIQYARTNFSEEAMWKRYKAFVNNLIKRPAVSRSKAGQRPPRYTPPTRYFQLLPDRIRQKIRSLIGRSPRLSYWLRNMRGV